MTQYYNIDDLPKVVFVHVPKCGGTSISKAFSKIYNHSYYQINYGQVSKASNLYFNTQKKHLNIQQFSRDDLTQMGFGVYLFKSAVMGRKFLTGHIKCNSEMILALKEMGFSFVTIIRNPVDRFFSQYYFNLYRQTTDEDFKEYLRNRTTDGSKYIKYYGGFSADDAYDSDEAIDNALNNLKEFEVVGMLNEMDDFVTKMDREFGLPLEMPALNRNPAPRKEYEALKNSQEKRAMVEEICQPDLKLIEQLKSRDILSSS